MQIGRFINKLVDDREQFYQTDGAEHLLNEKNVKEAWNLSTQGPGEYTNKFIDDMAVTNTIITVAYDSTGREIRENDTIIVKFDESDSEAVLDAMIKCLNLYESMRKIQNNGTTLKNPLPDVKF